METGLQDLQETVAPRDHASVGTAHDGFADALDDGPVGSTRSRQRLRQCIVTRESRVPAQMIRFVLGPDTVLTPDLAERLPGRGAWVSAERAILEKALNKGLFARAFRTKLRQPGDLIDAVTSGLRKRCLDRLALARRSGEAVSGFEAVREALKAGNTALRLTAHDGSADGVTKLDGLANSPATNRAPPLHLAKLFSAAELGRIFGRDIAVHVAVFAGGHAAALQRDCWRLHALTGGDPAGFAAIGQSDPAMEAIFE